MSCEVATLPFQAYANYGTWSIGKKEKKVKICKILEIMKFNIA